MKPTLKEIVVLAMFSALMFTSKLITEMLPNIHLIGMLIVAITAVYGKKAIYAVYTFVLLTGVFYGFALWWVPYLYVWTVLWAFTLAIPKKLPKVIKPFVYMTVCSLHGFLYGVLYAPSQALLFGLDFKGMITWIIAGFPFDIVHGISNFCCGILIWPITEVLKKINKTA